MYMKKIIFASLLSLSALFVGCDEGANEGRFEPSTKTGWVQFETSQPTIIGSGCQDGVTIPVVLNVPVNDDGTIVYYSISDIAGGLSSQIIHTGSMLIPAGTREGQIVLDFADDIAVTGEFLVTLNATSKAGVSVGLSDNSKPVTHAVKISDRDTMLGLYDVVEDGQWEYQVEIVAGDAENELIIKGLYEVSPDTETRVFLDSSNGTVTFPPFIDNFLFTSSNPAQGDIYVAGEPTGANTFDSCTGSMDISFRLRFGANQANQTPVINAVLTRA